MNAAPVAMDGKCSFYSSRKSKTMQAIQVLGTAESPTISLTNNLDRPVPGNAQVLIRVHAAGITGDEIGWPEVYTIKSRIPGHEMSGVIEDSGSGCVRNFNVGDEVYALLRAGTGQCQAEWLVCSECDLALKPKSLSHATASALPMPCLTAWEAMADHAALQPGMRVLVTGASGAVGQMLIQLLVQLAQVKVTALASPRQQELLRGLGAAQVIDYHEQEWQERHTDFDVVFDLAGGDALTKSWSAVQSNGTIVTIGDPAPSWAFSKEPAVEAATRPEVKYKYFIVVPNAGRLELIAEMLDNAELEAINTKTYTIDEGLQAWSDASSRGRGYKVVLTMQ